MKINVKDLCEKMDAYIERKNWLESKKKEKLVAQAKQDYIDLAGRVEQIKELLPVIERIRLAVDDPAWMPNLRGATLACKPILCGITLVGHRYFFGGDFDKLEGVYFDLDNGNLGTRADFSPTAYNGYYTKPDDFIENWCFRTGCHGDRMLEKLHELVLKADEFIQCVVNNVDELDHKVQN